MHRKSVEVNEQPKKEISDEELRLLCLQSQYNLKPVLIALQQCDVAKEQNKLAEKEANKMDLNVSQNEANKADLISTENDKNKGDFNCAQVNGKGDSDLSETEQTKGDLTENYKNKEDSTQGENSASNRRRSARPKKSLEESDPLLKAIQENSPEELDTLLEEDGNKVNGSCIIGQEGVNTHDRDINIKTYGIWHSKKQKKNLKCPDSTCNQVFDFVKEMNVHVAGTHPDLRFHCQYCPKSYQTYNARYKHEHKYFKLLYCCHYCTMRFLFPGLRDKHQHQHTQKGLLPCTWCECKQMLSCKDALRQHIDIHTDERHKCEQCPKDFNTLPNLKQHEKGAHRGGFIPLCGAVFKWSDS